MLFAGYEPELPGQLDLPEDWDSPNAEKTAVQKFLYPDEADLPNDFEVRLMLASMADCLFKKCDCEHHQWVECAARSLSTSHAVVADAHLGSLGRVARACTLGSFGSWRCCADMLRLLQRACGVPGGTCGQSGCPLPAAVSWRVLFHNPEGKHCSLMLCGFPTPAMYQERKTLLPST